MQIESPGLCFKKQDIESWRFAFGTLPRNASKNVNIFLDHCISTVNFYCQLSVDEYGMMFSYNCYAPCILRFAVYNTTAMFCSTFLTHEEYLKNQGVVKKCGHSSNERCPFTVFHIKEYQCKWNQICFIF